MHGSFLLEMVALARAAAWPTLLWPRVPSVAVIPGPIRDDAPHGHGRGHQQVRPRKCHTIIRQDRSYRGSTKTVSPNNDRPGQCTVKCACPWAMVQAIAFWGHGIGQEGGDTVPSTTGCNTPTKWVANTWTLSWCCKHCLKLRLLLLL